MFQRLKGAIDSRIAEEQARQRQAQLAASPQRPVQRRRPPQNAVAGTGPRPPREAAIVSNEKGPDPSEFEPEFAIGDDESAVPSRVATPKPDVKRDETKPDTEEGEKSVESQESDTAGVESKTTGDADDAVPQIPPTRTSTELPVDVRTKLRKLERLEAKYGELLKAYRTAHARVQLIEPFEASLRENTPLTSINDPSALVEYLNQNNVKSGMVLDELKRVSNERDEFKKKFESTEDNASQLRIEVAELKRQLEEKPAESNAESQVTEGDTIVPRVVEVPLAANSSSPEAALRSPTSTSSRIPSFSLFSPRSKATSPPPVKESSEEFFSYDAELPKLEAELEERQVQIDDLKKQVQNLKGDLSVARESTEGMVQSLESATRELHTLRDAKDKFDATKSELEQRIASLESSKSTEADQSGKMQQDIENLQSEKRAVDEQLNNLKSEIDTLRRAKSELESRLEAMQKETNILNERLSQKDAICKDLEDSLAMAQSAARQEDKKRSEEESSQRKLVTMQGIMDNLRTQLDSAETTINSLKQDIKTSQEDFDKRPSSKVFGFLDRNNTLDTTKLQTRDDVVNYLASNFGLRRDSTDSVAPPTKPTSVAPSEVSTAAANKKKNKKKKKGKGGNATVDEVEAEPPVTASGNLAEVVETEAASPPAVVADISRLEQEIAELRAELQTKASTVERLSQQLKDQEALKEEIETLRDDLLHQGEEHVEARDALKTAETNRKSLQESVDKLEKELAEAQKKVLDGAEMDKNHKQAMEELEDLKTKSITAEKDLKAAEQLAAGRFKDITDLRELLSKAQPELRSLRNEVAELKSAKEDLKNKIGEMNRLESRHEDLKAELKGLSKRLGDKDSEIKELQKKIEQEASTRTRLEDELRAAQSEQRLLENRRQEAISRSELTSKDLTKSKEEISSLRAQLSALEDTTNTYEREVSGLKEEVSLKTALHSSSQALVQSLRDQTHELNTQSRESTTKAENLEEELAEAQRMLSERTRESQTMRMLLNQAETGTESRIREMKERMDAAIEERDRIEDEASVNNRRMMREVEEAKSRAREAQRALKVIEDEKEELENRHREWKRRREELEQATEKTAKEVEDVKAAMTGLREALDESERQVREAESQKADLRKIAEEGREKAEKLTKTNKNLTEELKQAQSGVRKPPGRSALDSGAQSSRTSMDSGTARSPAPNARERERPSTASSTSTPRNDSTTGLSQGTVDYVYLKNVLLQFLEQKDKGHQRALIPVLGMLLHFDRKDEQKWISAISAR